ncbi:MAG: hypothetical protein P8P83_00065 [Rickettsiaceae bacterium]|nr:hypothetical protein [Rickettsiaceae bacterium]
MALTYKFIQGLQTLLTTDWKAPIYAKINEIETQLATSPEERLASKIEYQQEIGKPIPEAAKIAQLKKFTKDAEKLKAEIKNLEGHIERNEFKIGIEPIATIV